MGHGRALSLDVHLIVVRLAAFYRTEDIPIVSGIPLRSVERILAYFRKHGTVKPLDPKAIIASKPAKRQLDSDDIQCLFGIVGRNPDFYLDELQETLSLQVGQRLSKSTIWRYLHNGGFTMKKITRIAAERSAHQRSNYLNIIASYTAQQLVFVDESSVDRRTTYRGRAWSICGTKAQRKAFFLRGKRYSVLPAISLDEGIIYCKIREGSFRSDSFKEFILGLLDHMQPYPAPNSVIIMDNCKIHKREDILEAIVERGMRYVFLPPYSPDYNPIELAFSAMKYHLRRNGAYVRLAMNSLTEHEVAATFLEALYSITPQDCQGWYRHCGYIA